MRNKYSYLSKFLSKQKQKLCKIRYLLIFDLDAFKNRIWLMNIVGLSSDKKTFLTKTLIFLRSNIHNQTKNY
jgi:hypothetical protein